MAHFAELDENNVVIRVLVVGNEDIKDPSGRDNEEKGIKFLQNLFGGNWAQTSYNTYGNKHRFGGVPFRKNYAMRGFTYDKNLNAFIPPKPFESWIFNGDTALWDPPIPHPQDDKVYSWNEELVSWEEVVE